MGITQQGLQKAFAAATHAHLQEIRYQRVQTVAHMVQQMLS